MLGDFQFSFLRHSHSKYYILHLLNHYHPFFLRPSRFLVVYDTFFIPFTWERSFTLFVRGLIVMSVVRERLCKGSVWIIRRSCIESLFRRKSLQCYWRYGNGRIWTFWTRPLAKNAIAVTMSAVWGIWIFLLTMVFSPPPIYYCPSGRCVYYSPVGWYGHIFPYLYLFFWYGEISALVVAVILVVLRPRK